MSRLPNPAMTRRHFGAALCAAPLIGLSDDDEDDGLAADDPAERVIDPFAAAVEHPDRLKADRARDANRLPARVLDFFDIKRGMHVADLMAGDGYYTEILARSLGRFGRVYCQNTKIPLRVFAEAPLTARLERPGLESVVRLDREFDDVGIEDESVDAAILIRFYHDFGWQQVDRAAFNALVFRILRPGAVFGVVDHEAAEGAGMTGTQILHRVESALVISEIEEAGFRLEARSWALANPEDTHDWNVFRRGSVDRDRTDRFMLLFRKP